MSWTVYATVTASAAIAATLALIVRNSTWKFAKAAVAIQYRSNGLCNEKNVFIAWQRGKTSPQEKRIDSPLEHCMMEQRLLKNTTKAYAAETFI